MTAADPPDWVELLDRLAVLDAEHAAVWAEAAAALVRLAALDGARVRLGAAVDRAVLGGPDGRR